MSDPTLQFPGPEPTDADDVVLAVETAGALWKKGDAPEAIRWLRRAAEAAEETGNDMRAVALARAAADLTTAGADAAKKTNPIATESRKPKLPDAPPLAKRSSPAPATKSLVSDPTQDLPAPPPRRHGAPAAQPAKAEAVKPAVAPGSSPSTQRPPAPSQRPSAMPRAASAPKHESAEPQAPLAQLAAMAKSDGAPLPSTSRVSRPVGLKAIRVAVTRTDSDGALSCRVLEEQDPVPDGSQSAVIVATEAAIDQLTRRR